MTLKGCFGCRHLQTGVTQGGSASFCIWVEVSFKPSQMEPS